LSSLLRPYTELRLASYDGGVMALPVAEAAVEDLTRSHRDLLRLVDSLSEGDWEKPVPYGEWTVKDLIAHVIGDMSPSGPGLILAGILTPQFIADTSKGFDIRARNASMVESRRHFTPEDLRQLLFEAHDAFIAAALRLDESHLPVLSYVVPMGPEYEIRVADWLWRGYHDRQHADDIRRALAMDYKPEHLSFIPEIELKMRMLTRTHDGLVRAIYSVADDAWAEESADCPGWTYHDIVAHVASNEQRRRVRLLSAMGEADASELEAISDIDGWNARATAERRDWPLSRLVDELDAGWHEILKVFSRLEPEHLAKQVTLGAGETMPVSEFIKRMSAHSSRHAGQLVPGSRARRTK
jgi:hypothetical protein